MKNIKLTKSQKKVIESHTGGFNRRDFMGLGLKTFAGMMLTQPLLSRLAYGQVVDLPPFMVFDLVGGAALPGNFLVGGKGGSSDLLTSYSSLGFNPKSETMDDRFGLPAPTNTSRMFEGMISTMSAEAQAGLKMTSIAHQSVDDSGNNTTSTLGLVAKYWQSKGMLKQKGLGSDGTNSGGRTQLSLDEPALRPEQLTDVTQLNLLSGLGFIKNEGISNETIKAFTLKQQNQYVRQYKSLAADDQKNLKEQYEKHFDTYTGSIGDMELDPRLISDVQQVFAINQNTQVNNTVALTAGIANTCLSKVSGPSCIALGGYDYHDGTQTTGDNADFVAGQAIGRTVELAYRKGQSLFFQVLTDGGCAASTNGREWEADSGDRSMTIMGSFKPEGVKQMTTQIGHYTNGQIAELGTHVGRRTSNVAQIVFLNYLANIGKEGDISNYFSSDELPQAVIDKSIAFTV